MVHSGREVQTHIRDSDSGPLHCAHTVGNLRLPLVTCAGSAQRQSKDAGSVQSDWLVQEAPGGVKLYLFIVNNQTDRQDRHSNAQYDGNTGGT